MDAGERPDFRADTQAIRDGDAEVVIAGGLLVQDRDNGHVTQDIPAALAEAGFAGRILPPLGLDPRLPALITAAVLGDSLSYLIGRRCGSAWIARFTVIAHGHAHAQRYFARHGPRTVVLARFVPVLRTFAPFAAGFGHMDRKVFLRHNVSGAVLWVVSLTALGVAFGDLEVIRHNLSLAILAIVGLSLVPLWWGLLRRHADEPGRSPRPD